ncbi:hypothetical protein E9840_01145 [Tissierella creatinini]|nr:hypothetical protein E9840_01145 [Tissierella creatinini]TJX60645.1 hypothetical protein E8P77_19950 [Soehngenia saccharolytica]
MKSNKILLLILIISTLFVLTGCMPNDGSYTNEEPANFLSGIWHGWIAPISLILSFFNNTRIYEPINTGFGYDFGFYLAIVGGFGGLSLTRKAKNRDKRK